MEREEDEERKESTKIASYLCEAEWYEPHVVGAQHRVEEDLLDATVEVGLKQLHLLPYQLRTHATVVMQMDVLRRRRHGNGRRLVFRGGLVCGGRGRWCGGDRRGRDGLGEQRLHPEAEQDEVHDQPARKENAVMD